MGAAVMAVLGLGEAGSLLARDLVAAGAPVRTYDPVVPHVVPGAVACTDEADAAQGADVVLSVNSAADAEGALRAGLPGVGGGAVWADLNTAAPGLKLRLADLAGEAGVPFADVALTAQVPGNGLRTPMLASGSAAARLAAALTPLGADVTVLDEPAGAAATRKLVRSVFWKSMATAVVEALSAARAADCEQWLRANLAEEFARADQAYAERLEQGTAVHAVRRSAEMAAAVQMLEELAVPSDMSRASRTGHERRRRGRADRSRSDDRGSAGIAMIDRPVRG